MLKVSMRGVRGSRPRHRPEAYYFGGNSTSLEFHTDPSICIFVDGGSGLIQRGQELSRAQKSPKQFHFLMTHTHWDHILALPYFEPLFDKEAQLTFYAADTSRAKFEDLFWGLFKSTHLGYDPGLIRAKLSFKSVLPNQDFLLASKLE